MRQTVALSAVFALSLLVIVLVRPGRTSSTPVPATVEASFAGPRYTDDGRLLRPEGHETWVFVGASLGLSYSEHARPSGSDTFHHVYLDPAAYAHFARTGTFPDPTMLVLDIHERADRGAPPRQGYFEGERLAVEVAVKDTEHLEDGWAYFDFSNGKTASTAFARDQCFRCHVEHAADDNVFTQFYPVLRRLRAEAD